MTAMIFKSPRTDTNYSKLPHQITHFMPLMVKKPSSLFVLIYILRHTWGWQQDIVPLTLDELQNGRKIKSGENKGNRIDNGTGLSRPTIISSLEFLEKNGAILIVEKEGERYFGINVGGKMILPPQLNDFTDSGKMILPMDSSGDSDKAENSGPKESVKKDSKKKDSAPKKRGANSNGGSQQSPPIVETPLPLKQVDVNPKTNHQKLFEYVANNWYKAHKYSDGQYYFVLNGKMEMVTGGEIGSAIKRFKAHFGDKMKVADLEPFVQFYNQRCTNVLALPRSKFALLKWINEWETHKRRFDPNHDAYASLVVSSDTKGK